MRWLLVLVLVLAVAACGSDGEAESQPATPSETASSSSGLRIERRSATDPELLFAIQDGLLRRMDDDLSNEEEVLASASAGQRAVYALVATDGEVNNGGFEQYFFNSTGGLMDEAIDGARLVGAGKHEQILREAAAVFPGAEVPNDHRRRQEVFDSIPAEEAEPALGNLADRWYAAENELDRRLRAYVEAHPGEFFRG